MAQFKNTQFPFKRLIYIIFLVIPLASGCTGDDLPVMKEDAFVQKNESDFSLSADEFRKIYRLGPGDVIQINVINDKSASGEFQIDGQGEVNLPYIGKVRVEYLTLSEAEKKITDIFSDGYYYDPQVTLRIIEFRPFFLIGEIESPGKYQFVENLTVLKAVASAGGFTYRANKKEIKIIRNLKGQPYAFYGDRFSPVMPGDVIEIKERLF